jgi:signal transduction histidine kinase
MAERKQQVGVLVVDDNAANLTAVEAILAPLGERLVLARSGEEALHHLLSEDFAVVLLDVIMPGITGLEVAALMRARPRTRDIPLIFLTAHESDRDAVLQGYLHRASDYLIKPFDPDVLRAKVGVFVDLFRAREAAKLLAREEERRILAERKRQRFYRLLMQAPVAIAVVAGPDHIFELTNERFCCLANRRDLVGKRLAEAYPELASATSVLDGVYRSGEPWSATELPVRFDRRGSGEIEDAYFDVTVDPLRDEDGSIRGLIGAAADVTEHIRTRRARDDFFNVASHELKTPLTTLELQTDLIANAVAKLDGAIQPVLHPKIAMLKKQLDRLERLVFDLLDVSRLRSGTLDLTPEELDLASLAKDVVERLAAQLAAAGCATTVKSNEPVVGNWDRARLEQVTTNLLTNASKYGAGHPVEVVVEGGDHVARLSVIDHGAGIAPENQERIFERFERATPNRRIDGLGLGLWIVSRVVRALGGTIHVHSALGAGAEFVVELPR